MFKSTKNSFIMVIFLIIFGLILFNVNYSVRADNNTSNQSFSESHSLVLSFSKDVTNLGALGITINYDGNKCEPILKNDNESWEELIVRDSAGIIKYITIQDFSGEGTLFDISGNEKTNRIKVGFVSAYGSFFSQGSFVEIDLLTDPEISINDFNFDSSELEILSNKGDLIDVTISANIKGKNEIITTQGEKCNLENKMCGGIAGIKCCPGLTCELDGDYPDAGGICVPENECVIDSDCPIIQCFKAPCPEYLCLNGVCKLCVSEGESLGAVVPSNTKECCSGLYPYIPAGIDGTRGTCQKAGYCKINEDCSYFSSCINPICLIDSTGAGTCSCDQNLCVGEGENLGAVVLGNTKECCPDLEAYIPTDPSGLPLLGTRGICMKKRDDINKKFCTSEYKPVCGVDGKTYSNKCIAKEINNIEVAYEGECRSEASITKINNNAKLLKEEKFEQILTGLNEIRSLVKEQQTQIKYLTELKKDVQQLSEKVGQVLNNFITYGVDDNTKKLGAGERAAVIHAFKNAFKKLPETENELADAIKIANGRWPSMRSLDAEKNAREQFQKIYKKIADMDDSHDNAAITVMAYGLRQRAENRNMDSERDGSKTFHHIYGYHPISTEDWNIMQAITYSGATRGIDTDGDLLTDEREAELGTYPNNPDSDGDSFLDGVEVANGYNPLGEGKL